MAGHSKWTQIKRQKGVTDAARSRVFARYARAITLESKKSDGNLLSPTLAAIIERAKTANMPKDNIERAVAKGIAKDASAVEQVVFEFYGPGGVAVIATAFTDSRNRTVQEIKHLLLKNGCELGAQGSASWAFTKSPDGRFSANEPMDVLGEDEAKLSEILTLLDEYDDVQEVFTNARDYESTGD